MRLVLALMWQQDANIFDGDTATIDNEAARNSVTAITQLFDAGLANPQLNYADTETPEQPLTVGAWSTPLPGSADAPCQTEIDRAALDLSDITTFHAYWDAPHWQPYR